MFFFISKIFHFLVSPFTWFILLLILGLVLKKKERKRKFFIASFAVLFLFSNPFLVNEVFKWWEIPPVRSAAIAQPYDVGILLGGSLRYYDKKLDRPMYSQSVDRLLQTIALYKQQKIKKILLSGGSGSLSRPDEREADIVVSVLGQMGIPPSDVILESDSRNTYENAKFTAAVLHRGNYGSRYLLITSSFHMRRSAACYRKAGLDFDIYPVDPRANYNPYTIESSIIPNSGPFMIWDALIHEWIGMAAYKMMGYI